jgi:histidyl-tRNA synthetase
MYDFVDRGGRHLALRPEGTASIVRAFVQHRPPTPWRAWYVTPAWRYERPQAGRYRQHHQLGVEVLGAPEPTCDIEVIALAADFYRAVGLATTTLTINSMGDETCRPGYLEALRRYLADRAEELCPEHQARYLTNALRVLDCKKPACRTATEGAPELAAYLCSDCRQHHQMVETGLADLGISYVTSSRLVRGFDYYTRTTFEFAAPGLDAAQNGVGGGGRYDGLAELLGGPPTAGIGFGIGIERLLLARAADGVAAAAPVPDCFVVDLTDGAQAVQVAVQLRRAGLQAQFSYGRRSAKGQFRQAEASLARFVVVIGADEWQRGAVAVRPIKQAGAGGARSEQEEVSRAALADWIRARSQ